MSSRAPTARSQGAAGFDGLAALRTLLPRARAAFASPSKRPPGAAPRPPDTERVRRFDSLPSMGDAPPPSASPRARRGRASRGPAAAGEKGEEAGEASARAKAGARPEGGRARISDGWRALEKKRSGGRDTERNFVLSTAAGSSSPSATEKAGLSSAGSVERDSAAKLRPAHHAPNGGFVNPWQSAPVRSGGRLTAVATSKDDAADATDSSVDDATLASLLLLCARPDFAAADQAVAGDRRSALVHWLGHSTFVIQTAGLVLLTDPVWTDLLPADPGFSADGLGRRRPSKRLVPPICDLDTLPPIIDAVLLSGAAADHFDASAVALLAPRVRRWLVPLGLATLLRDAGVDPALVVSELDWWGKAAVPARQPGRGAARFVCTPTHARPRQDALWCAWHITLPGGRTLYFCGAGGLRLAPGVLQPSSRSPLCPAFRDVRLRCGKVDMALLPIGGSRRPRSQAIAFNMNAEDVLHAHYDLGARKTIVHRWGTFHSPGEPPLAPVRELESALLDSHTVSEHDVMYLSHGHQHKM